tara:strand:- start:9448 stop:10554 length:1107 start_codon:yes stop_codon:yes gene_type:complete
MKIKFTDFISEYKSQKKSFHKSLDVVGKKGQYILGDELKVFENNVKKFLKVKYVIGVGNWTEGMGLVCKALDLKKDDEIITVSNSFIATCGAIAYYGCKPVLADVGKDLNIDCDSILKKITRKTKAIMPVHLSGIPAQIDMIKKICKKKKLYFIEDAAHAFGAKFKNKFIGTLGDVGIFSLHPRKNFHVLGDGGLITTNNKQLFNKISLLRNHGLKNRDTTLIWGTNSRLDNFQASIANNMLKTINKINKKHLIIAEYYNANLKNFVQIPIYDKKLVVPTFHQYIIRTKFRDKLKKFLKSHGIETAIHYPKPIHKQKAYIKEFGKIKLLNTEKYSGQILSLPIHNWIKPSDLKYIVDTISLFFKNIKI